MASSSPSNGNHDAQSLLARLSELEQHFAKRDEEARVWQARFEALKAEKEGEAQRLKEALDIKDAELARLKAEASAPPPRAASSSSSSGANHLDSPSAKPARAGDEQALLVYLEKEVATQEVEIRRLKSELAAAKAQGKADQDPEAEKLRVEAALAKFATNDSEAEGGGLGLDSEEEDEDLVENGMGATGATGPNGAKLFGAATMSPKRHAAPEPVPQQPTFGGRIAQFATDSINKTVSDISSGLGAWVDAGAPVHKRQVHEGRPLCF